MAEGESCRRVARDEDGESERRSDACSFSNREILGFF